MLNGTVNPDFSQVEADVAQLQINRRFALFYPEKRPFFLEGGDFFLTPLQAVFTRTVADPLWGTKLTGKVRPHGHGLLRRPGRDDQPHLPVEPGLDAGLARPVDHGRRVPPPPGHRPDVDARRPLHRADGERLRQPRRRRGRLLPARPEELRHRPVPPFGDGLSRRGRLGLRPERGPLRRQRRQPAVPALLPVLDRQRDVRRPVPGLPGRLRLRASRRHPDRNGDRLPPILGQAQGLVQPHPARGHGTGRLGPRRHPDRPRPDPRPDVPRQPGDGGQRPRQFPADVL
ncbi:MAG: hypothetical protein MZV64_63925 [Ignavibacteriales bacterium]|nr:hypothetical protein [Ignavibacteriales bacterium]